MSLQFFQKFYYFSIPSAKNWVHFITILPYHIIDTIILYIVYILYLYVILYYILYYILLYYYITISLYITILFYYCITEVWLSGSALSWFILWFYDLIPLLRMREGVLSWRWQEWRRSGSLHEINFSDRKNEKLIETVCNVIVWYIYWILYCRGWGFRLFIKTKLQTSVLIYIKSNLNKQPLTQIILGIIYVFWY